MDLRIQWTTKRNTHKAHSPSLEVECKEQRAGSLNQSTGKEKKNKQPRAKCASP